MKYDRALLISIDSLSRKYQYLFEDYFTIKYIKYQSTNTWTLPSHVAMLSGVMLPRLYYVMNQKDVKQFENFIQYLPTIATLLKRGGFKSRAITGGGFMSKYFGWGYDWESWQEAENTKSEWNGEKILPKKNEFLFLHTYYVHNWFNEKKKLLEQLFKAKDNLEKGNKYDVRMLITEWKKAYIKRVKTIAKRLSWIKSISPRTLVILTSDHGELFSGPDSFHHGNFALTDSSIFEVPLLIRENTTNKTIEKNICYDFLLPQLICEKLDIPFESIPKMLIRRNRYIINQENLKEKMKMIFDSSIFNISNTVSQAAFYMLNIRGLKTTIRKIFFKI